MHRPARWPQTIWHVCCAPEVGAAPPGRMFCKTEASTQVRDALSVSRPHAQDGAWTTKLLPVLPLRFSTKAADQKEHDLFWRITKCKKTGRLRSILLGLLDTYLQI